MFSHKNKAERTAAQAWDYLSSAMAAAGESAREAGRYTADVAGSTAADLTDRASSLTDRAGKTGTKLADKASKKGSRVAGKASRKSSKLTGKAGKQSSQLADKAGKKASSAGNEAWSRANNAANALAGRKPGTPWGLVIGFTLIGVAVGWAAATTARAAMERQAENEELELAETAVIVTPTTLDS
jgi:hypothetical protein